MHARDAYALIRMSVYVRENPGIAPVFRISAYNMFRYLLGHRILSVKESLGYD